MSFRTFGQTKMSDSPAVGGTYPTYNTFEEVATLLRVRKKTAG